MLASCALFAAPAAATAAQPDLDLLADANIRLDGAAAFNQAGISVAGAGDVNDDGRDDVIVGAPGAGNNGRTFSGSAYVVYGSSTPTDVDLMALGAGGFQIDGAAANDLSGHSVAGAGDVNDDGRDDVIVGAPGAGNNGRDASGSAYVVYGSNAPTDVDLAALGANGFRIDGAADFDFAGRSVAGAGDVNGDGRDDVIVGAEGAGNNGRDASGSAYVLYGSNAPTDVDLAALGANGFRIDGAAAIDLAGASVAGAGDVNGDGRDEVIVGALGADNNGRNVSGSAYVVYGSSAPTNIDLFGMGANGFRIDGAAAGDLAGDSVSGAGDVNGDGRDDVIVGAPNADNNSRNLSGSAYLVYGSSSTPATPIDLAALGANGFRIDGAAANDKAGFSVAGTGDVNGDGRDEVVVGAPFAGNNGRSGSGSAYVVYGSNAPTDVDLAALGASGFRIDGVAADDDTGWSVAGAGDVNGDGRDDVIVGAPSAGNNGRTFSGSAYLITGDSDSDGVRDEADNCRRVANPGQADADMDASPGGDLDGGDACDTDDDNDGVDDGADNCPNAANTGQANNDGDSQGDACDPDDDNDGVNDGVDNCPTSANTGQANNDGDSQGDACDADDDNDGVDDGADNCASAANPDQADADGDGSGDACDPDDDNDGVDDGVDNCAFTPNSGQQDNDGDSEGDACDPDDDNDGVDDGADNCPIAANPDQADADGDGSGDACEGDRDGDGQPDSSDLCPRSAATSANGCPRLERTISLRRKSPSLSGRLSAKLPACVEEQSVQLRKTSRVPGRHRVLERTQTSANGRYSFARPDTRGRYYVVVRRTTIPGAGNCSRAREGLRLR